MLPSFLQAQLGTVGSPRGSVAAGPVELVDRCGSSQVVWEDWGGCPIAIRAVPTPGWLTSSATWPAMSCRAATTWATVAKVSLQQIRRL